MSIDIKKSYEDLSQEDKMYVKTVVPTYIAWTVYLLTGIPIGPLWGFL